MKIRGVDLLVETGYARNNRRGYQMCQEGKVPGLISHSGRTVRIIEDVFIAELRKQAARSSSDGDQAPATAS